MGVDIKTSGGGEVPQEVKLDWGQIKRRVKAILGTTTPVDTGRMLRSYRFTKGTLKSKQVSLTIRNTAVSPKRSFPYPVVVEYGSKKMEPRKPVHRAADFVVAKLPGVEVVKTRIGDGK